MEYYFLKASIKQCSQFLLNWFKRLKSIKVHENSTNYPQSNRQIGRSIIILTTITCDAQKVQ